MNPDHAAFGHGDMDHCEGLTKRELLAAMMMQGFIERGANGLDTAKDISVQACVFADALIQELGKVKP